MKLIIFDLDQTLVDVISLHDKVVYKLFKEFFDVEAKLTDIDFAGKNLMDNFRELARQKNVPEQVFREKSQKLLEIYETTFSKSLPIDASKYVLPGAKELLSELSRTDSIVALYTGSPPGVVRSIFRTTGLGRYFKFCRYGSEVENRADMVRVLIEEAEKLTMQKFRDKNIVIVGDSTRDVECGKQFNALTIAVATGFHSPERLSAAGPDYLLPNLKDYREVLKAIGET